MKKILLGGSAIATMALLSAGAQAADPLKLSLGGYFQAYAVYIDQKDNDPGEPARDRRSFTLKREAEVHFKGETKLDNGLTVGVDVQLEAETCGDQIDESYLYFSGGWGRVIIGSENNAPYLLQVGAPAVDGNFDGIDPNYRLFNIGTNNAARYNYAMTNIDGDSEKFTYLTPVFAGFQAGISYSPANCEEVTGGNGTCTGSFGGPEPDGIAATTALAPNPQWQDAIGIGARYNGQFGPVKLSVGGGYGWAERKGSNIIGAADFQDRREWNVGASVGVAGFTFGAGYYRDNNGIENVATLAAGANRGAVKDDYKMWAAGINYGIGAFTVGGSYAYAKQEVVGGTDTMERILVGGSYTFGPGMTFRGSVQYHDLDGPGRGLGGGVESADNKSWAFVLGTNVNF